MNDLIQLTNPIPSVITSISRSPLRRGVLLIDLLLAWFALSSTVRAVDPPPDGGYPNLNTAEGDSALASLTSGTNNTAIGFEALFSNTTGNNNTATGAFALFSNTTGINVGNNNTATGASTLAYNTTGYQNTATGWQALFSNTTGADNTATGIGALESNTTGSLNTATGAGALDGNTTGTYNTANGWGALNANTEGSSNTANGVNALYSNTTGHDNVAEGFQALLNNTTGSFNIALGVLAGANLTKGKNNIDIGNAGVAGESNKIRIGTVGTQKNTFIAGISGATVAGGIGVIVDSNGHLGTVTSSARFKEAIKPMDKASEAILALQPVTFRYKHELDPDAIPQFGLVAEQVEKVNPDLVARDDQGKVYTVRYEAVNAMLLNEFLKEHRKVEEQARKEQEQEATIAQQRKDFESVVTKLEATAAQQHNEIKALTASLKEQASQIKKVTRLRRVEVSKPTPQLVAENW